MSKTVRKHIQQTIFGFFTEINTCVLIHHVQANINYFNNPNLNNFWFVNKTNKNKLVMKLSGAVTISIYYLSIIHHHIHIIIYNNENHIYCPLWKETLSVLLLYIYISIKKTFTIEIYTTIVDISIISLIK